jgi:hypothetical protein
LLMTVWACFFYVILISSPQGVPVFVVMGYMIISALVNKREVLVRRGYLKVGTGPLFGSGKPIEAQAGDVLRWYVRHAVVPTRHGVTRFWAAGAKLADGTWVDVFAPYDTREQAFEMVSRAAAVFGGGQAAIDEVSGFPSKRNWGAGLLVLGWGGAFLAALLLSVWLELTRPWGI